jgi:hypothetical protein
MLPPSLAIPMTPPEKRLHTNTHQATNQFRLYKIPNELLWFMRLYSGVLNNYQRIVGRFWLSANHNTHVKDKITYTGAHRVRKINISPTPLHNFNFMLVIQTFWNWKKNPYW